MTVRLVVSGIARRFGPRPILRDVSFEATGGELVLITGSNGSGKSTLFEVLTGQIAADRGTVQLTSRRLPVGPALVVWERIHRRPRSAVRVVRQSAPLFASLTLAQHAQLGRVTPDPGGATRIADLSPYLQDSRFPNQMSFGERRAFAIERQLAASPRAMCLLDEPFAGLDEANSRLVEAHLRKARAAGAIIIVIEHQSNIPRFRHLIDRGYLLKDGTLHEISAEARSMEQAGPLVSDNGVSLERTRRRRDGVPLTISVETERPEACPPLFRQFAGIALEVSGGETVRIRAPNGWGKSKLGEAIAGMRTAFPARVNVLSGAGAISGVDPEHRYRSGLRFMPTAPRYPARTRVTDLYSSAGVSPSVRTEPLLRRRFETLSGGEMRFVALELALLSGGLHCVLDEPLLGLDAIARSEAERMFEKFDGAGGLLVLEPAIG